MKSEDYQGFGKPSHYRFQWLIASPKGYAAVFHGNVSDSRTFADSSVDKCTDVMHSDAEEGSMNQSASEDVATSCRTTITLSRTDHELLASLAESRHVSLAWMIREAIRTYLDQQTPLFSQIEKRKR